MPPCVVDTNTVEGKRAANALQLNSLRNAIPEEAFKKSAVISSMYMFFDYAMWFGAVYAIYSVKNSEIWHGMPFWQQALASVLFWNISGFFMWCIFVVGHDCGHSNFSESELLNDVIGHITHGSILVPYYPWQVCQ